MSVILQTRGEVGGGVAAHLQCPSCGHISKSHANQLSHMASTHPSCLDDMAVGRLGNILMYQSTARLFHCSNCFYTSRDFTKLYKHIITKHCIDGGEGEGKDDGSDGREKGKTGEEEEDEDMGEEKESPKRKRSSETEEEGDGNDEEVASQRAASIKPDGLGYESVLGFDGTSYRCLICGWKHELKSVCFRHMIKKHNIPKVYATQIVRQYAAIQSSSMDEDRAGLTTELLKEEMEATAKVIRFVRNRFVCRTCGWKTKFKGFAVRHVVRSHEVALPYSCKECKCTFFLPSHLKQHIRSAHRPGRFICPFCCFRSNFLGGLKRHCNSCNAREEEEGGGGRGGVEGEAIENEEEEMKGEKRKETRAERRRKAGKVVQEVEEQEEEEKDG